MQVTQREGGEFSNYYVGFFEGKCVAINPSREQLIKMLKVSEEKQEEFKEREYITETPEGETKLTLDFWLEELGTKKLFPYRITLIDKVQKNKNEDKIQYVSCTGDSTWVDDVSNLPKWFTHFLDKQKNEIGDKQYREALVGESSLYTFIKGWFSKADFRKVDANIFLDMKKLFRGNLKELTEFIGNTDITDNVVAMAEVRVKDTDGEIKHYQGVYNKNVLPKYCMKFIRNTVNSSSPSWKDNYLVNKFVEEIEGEYGSKNIYKLDLFQPYSEEDSVASTDKVVTEDGADY